MVMTSLKFADPRTRSSPGNNAQRVPLVPENRHYRACWVDLWVIVRRYGKALSALRSPSLRSRLPLVAFAFFATFATFAFFAAFARSGSGHWQASDAGVGTRITYSRC